MIAQSTPQHNPPILPTAPLPRLPEAPCSITGKITIDCTGHQVQITGRGLNGNDAARNYAETLSAIRIALAPPAPPTRQERLAALLMKGLACAVERKDFALAQRLGKAAALVAFEMVEPGHVAGTYVVRSQTTPDTWHEIDEHGQCDCRWAQFHPEEPCTHRLAYSLWQRLETAPSATV